jgi:DNA-directed RNA polymerase specialized sigma subunit
MKQQGEKNRKKEQLKDYLNQYYTGRMVRTQLERRLINIKEEMNTPIGGHGYVSVNMKNTKEAGPGAASFVYRLSEIETRIENQKNQVEKSLLKVMDILDFLEEGSPERMILELRFIDGRSWAEIEKEMHLCRRACFSYQNKALEKLLEFKKVEALLIKREKD